MSTRMRVVFAGTPEFAVPCLEALFTADSTEVVGVYTQPDRQQGRGRKIYPSAVKQFAESHANKAPHLPILQPESLQSASALAEFQQLKPDLFVVVAYGLVVPCAIRAIPRFGCVNLHASLLPRWRGAAPIQRAIEAGDTTTGVSLMQMEQGIDTGAVLADTRMDIDAEDTSGKLHDKLSHLAAELLTTNLPALAEQTLTAVAQDESQVCYASKLKKTEADLDWRMSATDLERKVRAFNSWPVARVEINGIRLRILRASTISAPAVAAPTFEPGEVIQADKHGIVVATGKDRLVLHEVQKPGGAPMPVAALLNGMTITPGMRFTITHE